MTTRSRLFVLLLGLLAAQSANAAAIQIADARAYIHANGTFVTQLNGSSTGYFSTLDASNIGTFGWTFTNTTSVVLTNVSVFGFLDADIDRDLNTFFNEYGQFLSLALPGSAPGGAIGATSWQIDEPGFVFGTILNDLAAGSLQNANFVSSATPDDTSLALGFFVGNVAPGQTVRLTLVLSMTSIGGLQQVDPDSLLSFHLNGFATSESSEPPLGEVPEPSAWLLCTTAGIGALLLARKR